MTRTRLSAKAPTSDWAIAPSNTIQSRPFSPAPTEAEPDTQASLEHAQRFGHDLTTLPMQAKLTIGAPNDPYEQEADQVAAQVVEQINSPSAQSSSAVQRETTNPEEEEKLQTKPVISQLQREVMPEEEEKLQTKSILQREAMPEEEEKELQAKPLLQRESLPEEEEKEIRAKRSPDSIQREASPEEEDKELQTKSVLQREAMPEEEEKELQAKSILQRESLPEEEKELQAKPRLQRRSDGAPPATPDLESSIESARGSGQPIAPGVKESMEGAFNADFSGVTVHTDAQSDQLNRSVQARAFTTGQDIFFRQGEYQPNSKSGQELLAHELTHVVQQTGSLQTKQEQGKGVPLQKRLPLEQINSQAKASLQSHDQSAISTTKKALPNGQMQLSRSLRFTQTISRAEMQESGDADQETEASGLEPGSEATNQPEEPIFIDEIISPEEAEASSLDSISSTLTHDPTVKRDGAGPSGFGVTRSQVKFTNVSITPGAGTYTVTADLVHDITWQVRSGTGPSGQVDIQDENDSDIRACNYQLVAKDLTPNMGSDNGRPPRSNFWAEDLTIRHERFHAHNQRELDWGPQCVIVAQNWLNGQTATSSSQIQTTLLPQALTEWVRAFNVLVGSPAAEGDTYGDGAPLYQARADAIKTKGDTDGYGKVSTQVTVHPKGGGDYEIVRGDTLWGIAERTYGHGRYWRDIYTANPGKSRDGGNLIFPGTILTLPTLNVDQELSVVLSSGLNFVFTSPVTVPGGGTHDFLVSPSNLFTDTTNCTGNVDIEVVDAEGNALLTTTWNIPAASTTANSGYEATISITP